MRKSWTPLGGSRNHPRGVLWPGRRLRPRREPPPPPPTEASLALREDLGVGDSPEPRTAPPDSRKDSHRHPREGPRIEDQKGRRSLRSPHARTVAPKSVARGIHHLGPRSSPGPRSHRSPGCRGKSPAVLRGRWDTRGLLRTGPSGRSPGPTAGRFLLLVHAAVAGFPELPRVGVLRGPSGRGRVVENLDPPPGIARLAEPLCACGGEPLINLCFLKFLILCFKCPGPYILFARMGV